VRDIAKNSVKEKLARDEVVASITVRLVPTVEIVRIAKTAGFDSLYIDLEHSSFSIETASQLCIMALEAEVPAFVRVPANTPEYISRVLDGGALGVINNTLALQAPSDAMVVRIVNSTISGNASSAAGGARARAWTASRWRGSSGRTRRRSPSA